MNYSPNALIRQSIVSSEYLPTHAISAPPTEIADSTISRVWANDVFGWPPAIRTGIGTDEHTS